MLRERRAPIVVAAVAAADAARAIFPSPSAASSSSSSASSSFIGSTNVHVVVLGVGGFVGDVVGRGGFVDLWLGWVVKCGGE